MTIPVTPLYIDPGTGSMLFSIIVGATATLYFLGRAVLVKLKTLALGGKSVKGAKNKFVIYGEDKRYAALFEPVLREFENRKIPALYLTSSEDDPVFVRHYDFVKPEFIGKGNRAFSRLNFLSADVVLSTTPSLDVFQWKRSKLVKHYAHVMHMAGGISMYRLFGIDYYDSILMTGSAEEFEVRELEELRGLPRKEIAVVGCPYLDVYDEKLKDIFGDGGYPRNAPPQTDNPNTHMLKPLRGQKSPFGDFSTLTSTPLDRPCVLISPSWGASGLLNLYGEKILDTLVKCDYQIIIRPHPQSKINEKELLDKLNVKYKDVPQIEWDYNPDNIYSLARADIMLSDFSGIIADYALLFGRPVLYTGENMDLRPYDAYWLKERPLYLRSLPMIAQKLAESDMDKLGEIIESTLSDKSQNARRDEAREMFWSNRGGAGAAIVDFMIGKSDG